MDYSKVKRSIKILLEAIGEDPEREGLCETPDRVARMYAEIMEGYGQDAAEHLKKTFTVKDSEIVLEKNIVFHSLCEHHLLVFFGNVHIAYIPNGKVVGLSKLARVVEVYARRLQLQERLTNQIADSIERELNPLGVFVIIEAEHTCMTMRGIKKVGSKTVTVSARGKFKDNIALQRNVQDLIKLKD